MYAAIFDENIIVHSNKHNTLLTNLVRVSKRRKKKKVMVSRIKYKYFTQDVNITFLCNEIRID